MNNRVTAFDTKKKIQKKIQSTLILRGDILDAIRAMKTAKSCANRMGSGDDAALIENTIVGMTQHASAINARIKAHEKEIESIESIEAEFAKAK